MKVQRIKQQQTLYALYRKGQTPVKEEWHPAIENKFVRYINNATSVWCGVHSGCLQAVAA